MEHGLRRATSPRADRLGEVHAEFAGGRSHAHQRATGKMQMDISTNGFNLQRMCTATVFH
eukprot:7149393-Pyramimonas_sp.AAC.1